MRILTNPQRPVQLIIAGKAHPADQAGQTKIQEWTRFIRRPEANKQVIFPSDYSRLLTGQLVQGVDLWINTPRIPWEACGTRKRSRTFEAIPFPPLRAADFSKPPEF